MPLSLGQMKVGAVVDWNVEWKKSDDGKREVEVPKQTIQRGIIVQVNGDPLNETVDGVWVTFGPESKSKDKFEFNGVTLPMQKLQARELNLYWDADWGKAKEAWARTFRVPVAVGATFENRAAKTGKPKTIDALQLTGTPSKGPIADATGEDSEE